MDELDFIITDEIVEINSDMGSYFSEDAYITFWNSIRNYPILSREENINLALEAQNGNKEARDKLIKSNLRLVAWVANKYKNRINHMQILDIIQEGTIGLMRSIETFNPEKGGFITNAINWIRQAITRSISNNEEDIRLPVYLENKVSTYLKIVDECKQKKEKIPSDEELCEILDISLEIFSAIKSNNYNTISINQKVNHNDSDTEFENFIVEEDHSYDEVLNKMCDNDLLAVLKDVLNHKEYYVIYYRYIIDEKNSLQDVANHLVINRERIRQIEKRALKKIKPYMTDILAYDIKIEKMIELGRPLELYKTTPISINNIILFMYIKDDLTNTEKKIMYYEIFGKMKFEWYRIKFKISKKEYIEIKNSIHEKIKRIDINALKSFKNNILKCSGTKIFDYSLEDFNISDDDNLTYEDISVKK